MKNYTHVNFVPDLIILLAELVKMFTHVVYNSRKFRSLVHAL